MRRQGCRALGEAEEEKGLTDAQTHGRGIATPAGWGCTPDPREGSSCFLLSLAEAVVLNMEAGGMVKLLFPTQVSAKRRAGGWGDAGHGKARGLVT